MVEVLDPNLYMDWFTVIRKGSQFAAHISGVSTRTTKSEGSSQTQAVVTFTVREGAPENIQERQRALVFVGVPDTVILEKKNEVCRLFADIYSTREADVEEWVPSVSQIEAIFELVKR